MATRPTRVPAGLGDTADGPGLPARIRGRRSGFIGRERELAALADRLQAAERGEAAVVLLSGEPGIGKSRLLREFSARALADGWLVLSGRAYDTEGMPPYLPFVEVLRQYVHASPDEELQPLVSAAPEITMLLPEVAARLGPVSPPLPGPESERYALFQAVSSFLAHAANSTEARGLLVCLDDLHWADRSTLLLFQHFARNMATARLCLVGTYRTVGVDAGHPLFPILADLTRERLYESINLAPLSLPETAALVAGLTSRNAVSPPLIESVHDRTRGNPFFIEELVHHLQAEGRDLDDPALASGNWGIPEGVRQVIGSRIARLSPEDRRLLQAAAILGDEFGQMFPVIARMLDVDVSALAETVEEAVSAGMLREDGQSYRFAHALIRDSLLDELPLARRQRLHLGAARAIEEVYARNLDPWLSAIAVHYRLAGPFTDGSRAIAFALRAGGAAERALAYDEAIAHWDAALELMDSHGAASEERLALLERLGELAQISGFDHYARSIRYFEQALAMYEGAGDSAGAAAMHARVALVLAAGSEVNDNPAALRHLRAAEPFLRNGPAGDAGLSFYSALGLVAVWQVDTADGLADSGTAMRIARELGEEDRWVTNAVMHSHHLNALGRVREGLDLIEEAWHTADRLNNTYRAFVAANWLGNRLMDFGDPVAARTWYRREVDQPRQVHAPTRRRMLQDSIAESYALAGDLTAARLFIAETDANRGSNLTFHEGRWDRLEAFWIAQRQAAPDALNRQIQALADWWLARLRRVQGDTSGAIDALSDALAVGLDGPSLVTQLKAGTDLAIVLAENGRPDQAQPHLERCLEILAAGEDWRGLTGRVALAQAAVAGLGGCVEEAASHFARAIETFGRYQLPWSEAEALVLRGQVLARAGRHHRHDASESFVAALAIYSRLGAGEPWLERTRSLQKTDLGGRNGAAAPTHPDGLTEREVEVLRLIASGLSSKEIGDALVLSVRTVERHIANLYLKTNTHGRAQATAYALSHGLGTQTS